MRCPGIPDSLTGSVAHTQAAQRCITAPVARPRSFCAAPFEDPASVRQGRARWRRQTRGRETPPIDLYAGCAKDRLDLPSPAGRPAWVRTAVPGGACQAPPWCVRYSRLARAPEHRRSNRGLGNPNNPPGPTNGFVRPYNATTSNLLEPPSTPNTLRLRTLQRHGPYNACVPYNVTTSNLLKPPSIPNIHSTYVPYNAYVPYNGGRLTAKASPQAITYPITITLSTRSFAYYRIKNDK